MPSHPSTQRCIRLSTHVVEFDAQELSSAAGEHIDLRPRSFAVLRLLAENAGRLVID